MVAACVLAVCSVLSHPFALAPSSAQPPARGAPGVPEAPTGRSVVLAERVRLGDTPQTFAADLSRLGAARQRGAARIFLALEDIAFEQLPAGSIEVALVPQHGSRATIGVISFFNETNVPGARGARARLVDITEALEQVGPSARFELTLGSGLVGTGAETPRAAPPGAISIGRVRLIAQPAQSQPTL